MKNSRRVAAAVLCTVAAATASIAGAPAASSVAAADSTITAVSSDYDVASGEQFILRGVMKSEGAQVPNTTVKVKTYRNGAWRLLSGAVVNTRDDGWYRIRIQLYMNGDRLLRVVGIPPTDAIQIARKTLTIKVH